MVVLFEVLCEPDVLADVLVDVDVLVDADALDDVDADALVDADPAETDSLVDAEADPDVLAVSAVAEPEVTPDPVEPDVLAVVELVDWLVDPLVDSDAEPLVALPGVRTALPSVASVLRLSALTSYEIGVWSDTV